MSNIEIGFENIDNNLELNEPNLTIEITGLKTLNSFIGLEDTPLYYENGKFFKVDNNQIVYADITWADIVGEIRENPNVELAIVEAVNDIHREVTIEIANNVMEVHNLDADSHPFLKNIVDNNYGEISSQLENTKIDLENSINELKQEVDINRDNISSNTTNIENLNQELQNNYSELNTLISNNTSNINSNTQLINETIENLKDYSKTSEFSNVAFSGDYNDLINQPNIPSIDGLASIDYVDQKVDEAIGTISGFDFLVVDELPPIGESGHIYLVPNNHGDKNIYDEYIWVQTSNNFELIGSTEVDLSNYYTKEDTNTLLSLKANTTYVQEQLNNKVDKENGKSLIADTEIKRLASVKNYDDTEIKSDINDLQNTKQDKLTAGENVLIENNSISVNLDNVGASLSYNDSILELKNNDNNTLSSVTIESTPELDNITIHLNENDALEVIGNKTKDGVIKYDWMGTQQEYETDLSSGIITPTTVCAITDDEEEIIVGQTIFTPQMQETDDGVIISWTNTQGYPNPEPVVLKNIKGDKGDPNVLTIGDVTTGDTTNVTITGDSPNQVLNFVLEKGEKGDKGDIGLSNTIAIGSVTSGENPSANLTGESPNQILNLVLPKGDKGDKGDNGQPNVLSIGSVTGGIEANAEITGDSPNQVLNLVLPKGDKGDKGETGPANTLSIGTVTNGVEASATITGSAPNQVLNLVLPKGDAGPRGESTASIVQTHTDLTNSSTVNIILDENISIYRDTTLQNTTYVFDTSNITFTDTDTITFELKITMATPYTITFPQNIKWMEDTTPSFSKAGIYYFVFRSDDKGVTWYGNIQGRCTI